MSISLQPSSTPIAGSFKPMLSLEQFAHPEGLWSSWQAVERRQAGPGTDGQTVGAFAKATSEQAREARG